MDSAGHQRYKYSAYDNMMGASACQKKRWLECFHLSMPSLHNLQHVLDQPVLCSMLIATYRPD